METESSIVVVLFWLLLFWLGDGWLVLLRAALVRMPWETWAALHEESERYRATLEVLRDQARLAWLVQNGLLLSHLALAALATVALWQGPWPAALPRGLGLLAFGVALVLWENALSLLTRREPARWAVRLTPSGRLLLTLARRLPKGLTTDPFPADDPLALEALFHMVRSQDETPRPQERMLASMARFGHTLVREIMVPRIDMVALEVQTSVEEALDTFIQTGFSRLPVYRGTIDHIVGLLYAKDLLPVWQAGKQVPSLEPLLRPAYFVPEAKRVDQLLAEMQARHIHMAIVVDEYGGVAGLVTLEDIVEEILGEIQDEYDRPVEALYQRLSESEYLLSGRLDLDDFNALFDLHLDKEEVGAETLSGLIYGAIGRVPQGGEQVQVEDWLLTVEKVEGRRIAWVRARRLAPDAEPPDPTSQAPAPVHKDAQHAHS